MVKNICWNHDQMNWLEVKISVVLKSVLAVGTTTVSIKGFEEDENNAGYQKQDDKHFKTEDSFCFSNK